MKNAHAQTLKIHLKEKNKTKQKKEQKQKNIQINQTIFLPRPQRFKNHLKFARICSRQMKI